MDLLRPAAVQELNGFPKLGAANDAVVHEKELFPFYEQSLF